MTTQALQEDQLLELLLQLKKTTPEQARSILNSQPQIASALMAVMVNVNAVNMDVVQKSLAAYGALPGGSSASLVPQPQVPAAAVTPAPAIPPHLAPQPTHRGGTPTYPPQAAYPAAGYAAPPAHPSNPYAAPASASQIPGLGGVGPALPPALANIPDEQKALILRVISMAREEIYQLPFTERENIIKLRSTLGLPT